MRLSKITINNFKGLQDVRVTIPKKNTKLKGSGEFVSIVGPNNVGKSSIMDAIAMACPGDSFQATIDHFPYRDERRGPITVEFEFDEVTDEDQREQAIRNHVYNGVFRVRKTWNTAGKKAEYEWYVPECSSLNRDGLKSITKELRKNDDWRQIIEIYEQRHGKTLSGKPTLDVMAELDAIANECQSPLLVRKPENWEKNPGGIGANLDTVLPMVIRIPAVRDAKEEAEVGKKQSTIRKLVTAMFREKLEVDPAIARFRNASKDVERLFSIGQKNPIIVELEEKITRHLQDIISIKASLGFSAGDMNALSADLAGRTELWIREIWAGNSDAPDTRPEHQGHGAQRALIVSLLQLLAEQGSNERSASKLLFLVEEPEIYLHPEMCRRMRDALLRLAREGHSQVICTTHSPIFLDLADRHDGVVILSKSTTGKVQVVQRSDDIFVGGRQEQRDRLRMILNFDPVANEIFFAEHVCLVEGETEIAALSAIAEHLVAYGQIDASAYAIARRKVAIVNCRGKWTIPPFQIVLNAFGVNHRVVHDKDSDDEDHGDSATSRIFANVNDDENRRLVHDPNFDVAILGKRLVKDKPWQTTRTIHRMLQLPQAATNYFEFVLGCRIGDLIKKEENAGRSQAGPRLLSATRTSPPRKNLRAQISPVDLANVECAVSNLSAALGIDDAASPDLDGTTAILKYANGASVNLLRVSGDAMADTLVDGDWIAIEPLKDVYLERVEGERSLLPMQHFQQCVSNDTLYLLAADDDIDTRRYILRRVILDSLSDGGWFCRLRTDNPMVEGWGYLGQVIVHRTQRIQFIARIVGLVRNPQELEQLIKPTVLGVQ